MLPLVFEGCTYALNSECLTIIRISFFRFLISLSLGLGSCLVLEVLLDGDFPRLCGRLFGFNVFSLLRSVWDSFSAFVLLNFSVVLTLVLVLLVLCTTLALFFEILFYV